MRRGAWVLVCGILLASACGSWTLRRQAATHEPEAPSRPYVWQEEGSVPAPPAVPAEPAGAALDGEVAGEESLQESAAEGVSLAANPDFSVETLPAVEPPVTLAAAPGVDAAFRPGYRVQVFATRSRETADRLRDELQQSFAVPAYVEFDDPYFKIRVGDCPSENEGRLLQERLRNAGYTAAFVVPARIVAH